MELEPSYSAIKRSAKRFRNALCPTLQVLDDERCQSEPQEGWLAGRRDPSLRS
jgi:hypothetical protein